MQNVIHGGRPPERAVIGSVVRAGDVLRLIARGRRTLRVKEVAVALRLQRSTAYRYLASLAEAGFLVRHEGDVSYSAGPLLVELAAATLTDSELIDVATPLMTRLAEDVQESILLSVWGDRAPVVVRVQMDATRLLHVAVRVGRSLPLESAQGRTFLAYMQPPSERDHLLGQLPAAVRDEVTAQLDVIRTTRLALFSRVSEGTRSIATPVFDSAGRVAATVAIVGTTARIAADRMSGMAQALLEAGHEISTRLGASIALDMD